MGIFSIVMQSVKCSVIVNTFEVGEAVVSVKFDYIHVGGGSNGRQVQYVTTDYGKTWKLR